MILDIKFSKIFCIMVAALFISNSSFAQCAGNDNSLTICGADLPNVSNQSINLFSLLGTNAVLGGTWSDDLLTGCINTNTGVLNAHLFTKSGTYTYTYTSPSACTNNTAVITVIIGGYAGVPSPNISGCSDNTAFNLFQGFDGTVLGPLDNGIWSDDSNAGGLYDNFLNARVSGPGNFYFTYSMPALETCPAQSATVNVTIFRAADAGTATPLQLCSDNLSAYTNFNLLNNLSGQDAGGTWSESKTSELSGPTDTFINVQNIYNTKGAGIYNFAYTVKPPKPICDIKNAIVSVTIEEKLDFTGATLSVNSDICESEIATTVNNYTAVLKKGLKNIPNGQYNFTYSITGPNGTVTYNDTAAFVNNSMQFYILPSNFQQVADYTVEITNIYNVTSIGLCPRAVSIIDIFYVYPTPNINEATLTVAPVCQNFDAVVQFSGTSNLTDGLYDILYNLSGANTSFGIAASLNVVSGIASFVLPAALISNSGTSNIVITNIKNKTTNCSNTSTLRTNFIVNPLPDSTNLVATIKSMCAGFDVGILLNGLNPLTAITIQYAVSGDNTIATRAVDLTVVNGMATFSIPTTDLPNVGTNTFTISKITNIVTGCVLVLDYKTDFDIYPLPNIPVANDQLFCSNENATVASLEPKGSQYHWYDNATSLTPLLDTTPLSSKDYFVKEINAATTCESELKQINVLINSSPQIDLATLTIAPICQNEAALVEFSGTSNLSDGAYDIEYTISGDNTALGLQASLNVVGGLASFFIAKEAIPNAGTSTITITTIKNSTTNCSNIATLKSDFTINPLPIATHLIVEIDDVCVGFDVIVGLKGLSDLSDIELKYEISGANTVATQTIDLTLVGGEAIFNIPNTNFPNSGTTTITITEITNKITSCFMLLDNKSNFEINPLPNTPVAADQTFCFADNATVAQLLPQGSQYQWFDSATSTTPLLDTTVLTSKDYFVKEVNASTACESALKQLAVLVNPNPQIDNATLTINPICQKMDALVQFTGTSNLVDGAYDILYDLNGKNSATSVIATMNCVAGSANFSIPSVLLPNSGDTTLKITSITNILTDCMSLASLSKAFVVNELPVVTNMRVVAKDACLGKEVSVQISGLGTLTAIDLSYAVSGSNSLVAQKISLIVSSGNTSFSIPASSLLNVGNNTLSILDITNTGNSCSTLINSSTANFNINALPLKPIATNQEFCIADQATVASLVPNGTMYRWYDSETSTTALPATQLLNTQNYFLRALNTTTTCESEASQISVVIRSVAVPILKPNGDQLCGIDKPTIADLSANTQTNGSLTWYDAAANGTAYDMAHLLEAGVTYYGFDYDDINCASNPLTVTVSLTNCTVTPENFFIPDGFSPNGDQVNDMFQITSIEFLFPNYTLEIYNRYGNLMFKGNVSKPAWDGTNSNSNMINGEAPAGVYFYIINFNKDNLAPKQGHLYLNR